MFILLQGIDQEEAQEFSDLNDISSILEDIEEIISDDFINNIVNDADDNYDLDEILDYLNPNHADQQIEIVNELNKELDQVKEVYVSLSPSTLCETPCASPSNEAKTQLMEFLRFKPDTIEENFKRLDVSKIYKLICFDFNNFNI